MQHDYGAWWLIPCFEVRLHYLRQFSLLHAPSLVRGWCLNLLHHALPGEDDQLNDGVREDYTIQITTETHASNSLVIPS